jgi:hypothetical protein
MIRSTAIFGTPSSALAAAGSSLPASKSLPGSIPSRLSLVTIGASAVAGGFSFISAARSLKYSVALSRFTCSRTAVFVSTLGSTVPVGGVYGLPYADRGTSLYWSCSACTAL